MLFRRERAMQALDNVTPTPPAPAAPVTYLEIVRAEPKPAPLRKPDPQWIAYQFYKHLVANDATEVPHLADDLVDGMREWCRADNIKPCNKTAFLTELRTVVYRDDDGKHRKGCERSRPWKLDPVGNEGHAYIVRRMRARKKIVDRPMLYEFFARSETASDGQAERDDGQQVAARRSPDAGLASRDRRANVKRGKVSEKQAVV